MPTHSPRPTAGRKRTVPRPDAVVLVAAPRTLTPAERAIWRRIAPSACTIGTLTPETSEGFVLLCQTLAARDEAKRAIDAAGLLIDGAVNPLCVHYRQLGQRAESLMAKYCLAAPGRPVTRPAATPVSPWAGRLPGRTGPPADVLADVAAAHAAGAASDEDVLHALLRVQ